MSAELDESPEGLPEVEDSVVEAEKYPRPGPPDGVSRYPNADSDVRVSPHAGNKYAVGSPGGWGISKFKQEFVREAMIAARAGMTDGEIAQLFDISPGGLILWKYQHPELEEAINEGKKLWDARVEASFAHVAVGYSHKAEKIFMTKDGDIVRAEYVKHYPPNHQAAAIWLANRRRKEWSIRGNTEEKNVVVNVSVNSVRASIEDKLARLRGESQTTIEGQLAGESTSVSSAGISGQSDS